MSTDTRQSLSVNSTSIPQEPSLHAAQVALCIAIPVLLLVAVIAIVLVIFIFWAVRKRHSKQKDNSYRPVPQEESINNLSKALNAGGVNLPFPPRVQMTATKVGGVQPSYTCASQIEHRSDMSSEKFQARYPFIQHRAPSPQGAKEEKRPPRLRTRRKGNHKHARGKNIIVRRGETIDSSPTTEIDSRDVSPLLSSPAQAFILPAKHSTLSPGNTKGAEVYLTIRYTESQDLIIRIEKVENLPLRDDGMEVDAYVRVYFTPARAPRKTSKTHTERRNSAPVFDEEITYLSMSEEELNQITLNIEVLDYKSFGKHLLLGRSELAMKEVDFTTSEVNISLPLSPPQERSECDGTVLLSLCFDPENRKLSLIVLRAKDLNNNRNETDPMAKVTVELKDRVLSKLKTKKKTSSCSPIFNEAISCTVGLENIRQIKITVVIINEHKHSHCRELGKLVLSSQSTGDQQRHWNDIITTTGKHIAEWHDLHS